MTLIRFLNPLRDSRTRSPGKFNDGSTQRRYLEIGLELLETALPGNSIVEVEKLS